MFCLFEKISFILKYCSHCPTSFSRRCAASSCRNIKMKYEVVLTTKINEVISGLSSRTDVLRSTLPFALLIVILLVLIQELVFFFNLCLRILSARAGIIYASRVSETSANNILMRFTIIFH